jgi:hypothetical protein
MIDSELFNLTNKPSPLTKKNKRRKTMYAPSPKPFRKIQMNLEPITEEKRRKSRSLDSNQLNLTINNGQQKLLERQLKEKEVETTDTQTSSNDIDSLLNLEKENASIEFPMTFNNDTNSQNDETDVNNEGGEYAIPDFLDIIVFKSLAKTVDIQVDQLKKTYRSEDCSNNNENSEKDKSPINSNKNQEEEEKDNFITALVNKSLIKNFNYDYKERYELN